MPNVMGVLRAEIRRLARKETKQELTSMRKQLAQMRRLLAESRRRVNDLEARARTATRGAMARVGAAAAGAAEDEGAQIRFSPKWVKTHRSRLGMSRELYARLIGVSPQTIMGWEAGRSRPRRGALRAWREVRGKGVRELRAMVANGSGGETTAAGGVRKRGRRAGVKRAAARTRVRRAAGRRAVRRRVAGRAVKRTAARKSARRAVKRRAVRGRAVRARAAKRK